MTLAPPVAVVTGAGRGLGAALAREAGSRGMRVVLADIDQAGLAATERELRAQDVPVLAVHTDTGDSASIDYLAERVHRSFGSPSLLVNNAGIEVVGRIWDLRAADLDRIVQVNLLGAMHMVRAFVPAMIDAGSPARIVNVASLGAMGAMPLQTGYIVTKQALLSFSEGLQLEFREFAPHLDVSVVLPGAVDTQIFEPASTADPLSGAFRQAMGALLTGQGLSPSEAAGQIMKQIDEGRFWVSCHFEQLEELARSRAARLAGLNEPFLDETAKTLMRAISTSPK